jgi:hypothetical protein
MNARWSLITLVLGPIISPALHAQAVIATGVDQAPYLVFDATQAKASAGNERLTASLPKGSDRLTGVSQPNAEASGPDPRDCPSGNCASLRTASYGAPGVRLPAVPADPADPRSQLVDPKSDENSIALMDLGLMLLFAFGMLAYPLVRRQRALRRSLVFTSYIQGTG